MTNPLVERVIAFLRKQSGEQGGPTWLVGGFVRDLLLRRPSHDLDLVVPGGAIRLARMIGAAFDGSSFVLDADRDVGRAIIRGEAGETVEVDVARLRVPDLFDDLSLRDFTVNAIALSVHDIPATGLAGELPYVDPFEGRADIDRRLLRAVTEGTFYDDPLRMLRAVRMVAELGFHIEDATFNFIRRDAGLLPAVAAERVRDELYRVLAAPGAWQHLRLLERLALLRHVLPESAAQAGVTQTAPHYQDVFDHSRSVVAHLHGIYALLWPARYTVPAAVPGDDTVIAAEPLWAELAALLAPFCDDLRSHLSLPLASGHARRDLLTWAAVAHDWGKPAKRFIDAEGNTHFYDHDRWGALLAETRLQALKFAGDEVAYVARLVDQHMRPTFLARDFPPTRRAIYRFFRDAESTGPDCVLLSLADSMATRATAPDSEGWQRRLETTRALLEAYFRARQDRVSPALLLDGRQVMAALDLRPGPQVGELLEQLREAQATGEVATVDAALAWLRARLPVDASSV
jgi:tRNA nucleotidyltransferase/poly(A) polymerase